MNVSFFSLCFCFRFKTFCILSEGTLFSCYTVKMCFRCIELSPIIKLHNSRELQVTDFVFKSVCVWRSLFITEPLFFSLWISHIWVDGLSRRTHRLEQMIYTIFGKSKIRGSYFKIQQMLYKKSTGFFPLSMFETTFQNNYDIIIIIIITTRWVLEKVKWLYFSPDLQVIEAIIPHVMHFFKERINLYKNKFK